jgi:hypothetical protein
MTSTLPSNHPYASYSTSWVAASTPNQISNLYGWFKPETLTPGQVSTWTNSVNGYTSFTTSSGARNPTAAVNVVGSYTGLQFDGLYTAMCKN